VKNGIINNVENELVRWSVFTSAKRKLPPVAVEIAHDEERKQSSNKEN
jgi:hypothetical protein